MARKATSKPGSGTSQSSANFGFEVNSLRKSTDQLLSEHACGCRVCNDGQYFNCICS